MAEIKRTDNESFFEDSRLYDTNSRMHAKISAKIREIFAKLFRNTDINLDEFYFTGYDSEEPNAYKNNTAFYNTTVIAVSYGLIKALNRTEEFAAVLAHECGHYIWESLIGGDNTIIQERSADIHSVDMMINAGYNPRYVIEMQKKIFGHYSNSDVSFDVHGSAFQRIEDVKAYMTKIASEKGDFPEITNDEPDVEWAAFKAEVEKIHAEEGYDSFWDKKLKEKFGEKDVSKLDKLSVLKFFFENIKTGEWYTSGRCTDLMNKLFNYNYSVKTPEEISILQDIFLTLHEQCIQDVRLYDNLGNLLSRFNLGIFGPFQEQYENIENLIKYCYDEEKAIHYAEKIYNLLWTFSFFGDLNNVRFPTFKALGKDNVGKKLPWVQLESYDNTYIERIANHLWRKSYFVEEYNQDDYFIVDDIVIAYGEEAHKMRQQAELEKIKEEIQKKVKEIEDIIGLYELYYGYNQGKISKEEYLSKYMSFREKYNYRDRKYLNGSIFTDLYKKVGFDYDISKILEKYRKDIDFSEYKALYEKIKKTDFYKDLILTSPEVKLCPDYIYKQDSIDYFISRLNWVLCPGNFSKFNEFLMNALLKESEEATKDATITNESLGANRYEELEGIRFWSYDISDSYISDGHMYEKTDFYQKRKEAVEKIIKYQDDFKKQTVLKHAVKNKFVVIWFQRYIEDAVIEELSKEEPSEIIADMANTLGITPMPKTAEELKKAFVICKQHCSGYANSKPLQLLFVFWAEYLKNGYKCNPVELLPYFMDAYNKDKRVYSVMQDIFGKYITVSEFKTLSLMDKVKLYEFMDTREMFSEKTTNKNNFIRIIVNEIIQQKDNKDNIIKDFVEPFLTRRPITEYGKKSDRDLDFANEREKLIDFYAQYWAEKLGKDDSSQEYLERVKQCTDFISTKELQYNGKEERLFSQMIAKSILDKISDKVVAQEKAAIEFANAGKLRVNANEVNGYDYYGRAAESAFSVLAKTPQRALSTIRFLNKKLSYDSVDVFLKTTFTKGELESYEIKDYINKQSLTMIHENFWSADLPIRAYVMNKLLNAYTTKDQEKLNLIVDTYFKKDSPYYNDAIIVLESVYNNLQDYEKGLILSALLSSGQNEDNTAITNGQQVGRGLKMFFQAKGGAFVKFGQLLSYLPSLDSDIRKELSTLREKANLPTRDELFEMLRTSLPEAELKKISYVGKILGAGSIYVTVHVKYDNQDCVISLMRPNTKNLMGDGINMIARSIEDMAKKDKKFEALKNIVKQAKLSCESEIDVEQDYDKYLKAVGIYEKIKVHTSEADYSPYVARWIKYGSDKNKENAYKIMEMAQGESLTSDDIEESEKHDMAIGYVALELAILLSGAAWDTDRHMGQQNFHNKSFQDFCIGIFDTGAQMSNAPGVSDKIMLGHLLYELIREAQNGKNIADVLNSKVEFLDSLGKKFGIDTVYIDGVQRGLIALSDIIEYQKEIKDEEGNIIQERKTLTREDLQNIIVALMNSGLIDKTVMRTIRAKAIINKLRVLRPGWFETLSEGFTESSSNITVQYTGNEPEVEHAPMLMKAKAEIERLIALREAKKHLGIDTDVIIKTEDTSSKAM